MSRSKTNKPSKKQRPAKIKKNRATTSFWKDSALLLPFLGVLLITAIAFFPSLGNDFVNWDDDVNILENPNLRAFDWASIKGIFSSDVIGGYNPLTIFTFAIEKAIAGGFSAKLIHFNNLALHLGCVYFVYRIMLLLNLSRNAALIAALLFGIHPLRVESVAWATERKDVLFGIFYLAALFNYIKYVKFNQVKKYFVYALVLFVLSLFSKIQAVALPLSMLAVDYYFNRPLKLKLVFEKIPFFALALFVGLLGIYILSQSDTLTDNVTNYGLGGRIIIGAYSFCVYLAKFVFPYEMSPLYPYPKEIPGYFYAMPLLIVGMLFLVFRAFQKGQKAFVFGFFFFAFNVVFVLQILAAGQGYKADRFTYIPYVGLFFLVAYAYDYFANARPQSKSLLQYGLGAYCLILAGLTWQQCGVWQNGETLWTHVLKYYQNTSLPYSNLGHFHRENGNANQALNFYTQALNKSRKAETYNSRGKTYFDMGDTPNALKDYSAGIQLDPSIGELYVNRGAAYGKQGNYDQALKDLNLAIEKQPDFKNGYLNRSLLHQIQQNYALAKQDIESYLEIDPYDAAMWYERGLTQRALQDNASAIQSLTKAIRLNPEKGVFYLERAKAYSLTGNKAAAQQDGQLAREKGATIPAGFFESLQ
ncbi:MAG: tetratricopeptide repeat protein [Saprospiraceae bacterium]